ncbi:MAG: hypothetical protein Athens101410_593 [Parcubacteria group bacterium Athens1014_10]|nr:MAG: hypothetical protein Athens101410_593 [Parcubacteria group bacterium Athens1014_10]TSD04654.1 MAG: hypothetical protein Athens071412_721 [Parcubacteria group bacterium Athens0714_12]
MDIAILFLVFISAWIPSFFWLWIYRLQDREQPEPRSIITKLFLAGVFVTIPALFLEVIFIPAELYQTKFLFGILTMVIITAVAEEFLKFYVTKIIVWKIKAFDQVIDGVIYSISAATGFALVENFFYFLPFVFSSQAFSKFVLALPFQEIQGDFWLAFSLVFLSRFLFTTLMHTLASGVMGLYLGKAKFDSKNSSKLIAKGLLWAVAFHALFNFFALTNQVYSTFFITIIFACYFFPFIRKKDNLKVRPLRNDALVECAARQD